MNVRESFDDLFTSCQPRLVNYALRFTGSRHAARDLVQDAFVSLWEKYGDADSADAPALLFTMVRNKSINYLKRRKVTRVDMHLPDVPEGEERLYNLDFSHSTGDAGVQDEAGRQVDMLVSELPERCRQVFVMSRLHGLRNREIAEELGVSLTAVEKSIRRALRLLSKRIKKSDPEG